MNLLKNADFALALALLLGDNVAIRTLCTERAIHAHGPLCKFEKVLRVTPWGGSIMYYSMLGHCPSGQDGTHC